MKIYFNLIILLIIFPLFADAHEQHKAADAPLDARELIVLKTPSCGCCKKWISHIVEQGFEAEGKDFYDINPFKSQLGIAPNYRSCHTAISREGYAFEGHVPAKFIRQFLSEKHEDAIGLSVPAMPIGSPGMEVEDKFMPYQVLLLFKDGTSKPYAKVNTYEEQF
ncbi:DUF411 domain-containing protein [Pseudoalteromonas pernae]|uniref:DUF411 domain-containing protein n=1 Tax=Pseudoalteromonas pernae TaxID=3118054 RepID=UPI003241EB47